MTTYCKRFLLLLIAMVLVGCGRGSSTHQPFKQVVVHAQTVHKQLYFTGTIEPIRELALATPMDGVVEQMHFHYGQPVEKNKIVFVLNSAELQKQYNETLTEFLKMKDSYSVAKAKFIGTEDLWQAGLLSKNNYVSEQSSLNNARVSLMQATRKLSEMLEKMGDGTYQDLSKLSFAQFDKVQQALAGNHNLIHLRAPASGLLLYPPKASDDKNGRITVGSSVKAGQGLALIGDLSGIRVEIDVPEVDIDKIKLQMVAVVRGVAFPNEALKGELVAINAEALAGSGNALPSFKAVVEVKSLTPHQQALLKVGMSAAIELAVDSKDKFLVPIEAIIQRRGKPYVQLLDAKGKIHERQVTIGAAQADNVEIESGLSEGDVVLYE